MTWCEFKRLQEARGMTDESELGVIMNDSLMGPLTEVNPVPGRETEWRTVTFMRDVWYEKNQDEVSKAINKLRIGAAVDEAKAIVIKRAEDGSYPLTD